MPVSVLASPTTLPSTVPHVCWKLHRSQVTLGRITDHCSRLQGSKCADLFNWAPFKQFWLSRPDTKVSFTTFGDTRIGQEFFTLSRKTRTHQHLANVLWTNIWSESESESRACICICTAASEETKVRVDVGRRIQLLLNVFFAYRCERRKGLGAARAEILRRRWVHRRPRSWGKHKPLQQRFSNCGPRKFAGSLGTKRIAELYQTLNEWKMYPHMSVLKLPSLADLQ
jgi:hypothetical protein